MNIEVNLERHLQDLQVLQRLKSTVRNSFDSVVTQVPENKQKLISNFLSKAQS